jgi:hypothetical protein
LRWSSGPKVLKRGCEPFTKWFFGRFWSFKRNLNHRLADNLMHGDARAYIGTLFPITSTEAHEVVVRLLDKHCGKALPAALWSAQREVMAIVRGGAT